MIFDVMPFVCHDTGFVGNTRKIVKSNAGHRAPFVTNFLLQNPVVQHMPGPCQPPLRYGGMVPLAQLDIQGKSGVFLRIHTTHRNLRSAAVLRAPVSASFPV